MSLAKAGRSPSTRASKLSSPISVTLPRLLDVSVLPAFDLASWSASTSEAERRIPV